VTYAKSDLEVLRKAMSILWREKDFLAAEEINRVLWKVRASE
jgi:hypothetical protein